MSINITAETNALHASGASSSSLARWVSDVLCPPVIGALGIIVVAAHIATASAWESAILFLCLAVLVPTLYLLWLLYRGEVTDFHLRVREQRIKPMILIVAMILCGLILLIIRQSPILLVDVASVGLVLSAILFVITLRWKISGHTTAISSFVVLCLWLTGTTVAPLALSVPLVAWARIRLRRHTLAQTVAGGVLGTVISVAFCLSH